MAHPLLRPGGLFPWNTNQKIASADMVRMGELVLQTLYHLESTKYQDGHAADPPNGFVGDSCEATATGALEVTVARGLGYFYDSTETDEYDVHYKPIAVGADVAQAINAHDATNPRIDVISLSPATDDDLPASRDIKDPISGTVSSTTINTRRKLSYTLHYTVGTPAASPVAPVAPIGSVRVCEVNVPATSGPVTVTDVRPSLTRIIEDLQVDALSSGSGTLALTGGLSATGNLVAADHLFTAALEVQDTVDMLTLSNGVDNANVAVVGTWVGRDPAYLGVGTGLNPSIHNTALAVNDEIIIPISQYLRYGATLTKVIVVCRPLGDSVTMEADLISTPHVSGSTITVVDSDSQVFAPVGGSDRNVVTYTLSDTPNGVQAAGGDVFYGLRLKTTVVNTATGLHIYGIYLVSSEFDVSALLSDSNGT